MLCLCYVTFNMNLAAVTQATGNVTLQTLHVIQFEEIWPTLQYTSKNILH
jgi:hypothetical protein